MILICPNNDHDDKSVTLMELLTDPIRSRIYLEVIVKGEVTALDLMRRIPIKRSTMAHHLSKFEKAGIFEVRVQITGHTGPPMKCYSLNQEYAKDIIIEGKGDSIEALSRQIAFLESTSAHLQALAALSREHVEHLKAELEERISRKKGVEKRITSPVSFTFNLLSKEEISIWNKHYGTFLKEFESEIKSVQNDECSSPVVHVAFTGNFPILQDEE